MRELYPIHNRINYEKALREIERLIDNPPSPNSEDEVWLDAMTMLVNEYEKRTFSLPVTIKTSPVGYLKFLMEQKKLHAKDLVPSIGRINRVYEILNGKRQLTLPMIRKLSEQFGLPMNGLLQ